MTDSPDEIVKRVAGAEILQFPRGVAPAVEAVAAQPADAPAPSGAARDRRRRGAFREDGAAEGDSGDGGGTGGDAADRDRACGMLPLTDLGNAERFKRRYDGRLLYCGAIGWLAWDGRRWKRDHDGRHVALAEHATVRAIQDEAKAVRGSTSDFATDKQGNNWYSDKIRAWGRASEASSRMGAISKRACAMMAIEVDALDRDPMRINVGNGTLTVRKCDDGPYITLQPHDPADLITKICPVDYLPEALCPLYDAFLLRVQPEAAIRQFLHQWFGLSLTGDVGEQKMTFHYGKGRNGKGVCINTMAFIAGDYADSIGIESFLDSGKARAGGQATPDIAGLPGVRTLTTSEPKKGATLDEGFVKLFTGGDPIKARHLNRDFFEFRPQAKLTMQGNYRPKISGTDEGIWGRMVLVPWPVFIPAAERDAQLFEKLKAEGSGILNRLLDGLVDWLDHGLRLPEIVIEATAKYRADSDPLGRFLEGCTVPEIGARVQATDMHLVFSAWCKVNGEAQWSPKGLNNALTERGFATKKSGVMYWLDVRMIKGVLDFEDVHGNPVHGRGDEDAAAQELLD